MLVVPGEPFNNLAGRKSLRAAQPYHLRDCALPRRATPHTIGPLSWPERLDYPKFRVHYRHGNLQRKEL